MATAILRPLRCAPPPVRARRTAGASFRAVRLTTPVSPLSPAPSKKKVLIPIGLGTEEMEAVIMVDVLRRAGAEVVLASVESQLEVEASSGTKLVADASISDCAKEMFDLVALPGGMPGSARLRDCEILRRITTKHAEDKRLYGAICAAPAVALMSWGLTKRKKMTCHPAFMGKLPTFWAVKSNLQVSGELTTSRGPGTTFEFALSFVQQLFGDSAAEDVGGLLLMQSDGSRHVKKEFNMVEWSLDHTPRVMGRPRDAGPSAQWDTELTLNFCNLCILEIQKGNRPTTHFNKEGWTQIMNKFSEGTGRQYDRTQLKNRWDQLKKDWKLWRDLKHGATGLGWDSNKRTIMASDEWWNEKLQVFPAAKKFRSNGICPELEEKLDMMFSNIVATGEFAWTPNSGQLPVEMVEGIGNSDSTDDRDFPTQRLHDCDPLTGSLTGIKRPTNSSLKRKANKKGKMTASHRLSGKLDQLIDQTINLSTASSSSMCVQSAKVDMSTAVVMLDSILDVEKDEDLYGFAVDLIQVKEKRDLFIALEDKNKLWFLRRERGKTDK